MRYYLDTNLLVFILSDKDEISSDIQVIFEDYSSVVYVSNFAVQELLFLYRRGKFKYNKFHKRYKSEDDIEKAVKDSGIKIVYFNEHHFKAYKLLQIEDNHKDIIDHSIIAQAISDKIPLISSDCEFHCYVSQGLNFIFNRR